MTQEKKDKITEISKQFASGFKGAIDSINESGWLIVDPLSAYLNAAGIPNTPKQVPATEKHPQILILEFPDGSKFIPAGGDFKNIYPDAENWMWL